MKISNCLPAELSASEMERWRSFQKATPSLASPFLSPEFALVASRRRPDIRVAVIEDAGEIVAFFCFERGRFGIGRALLYGLSDCQGVVHAPGFVWDGADLLRACGLVAWEFDNLVGDQVQHFSPQDVTVGPSPIVDLREGWENWTARRESNKWLRQLMQRYRKLEREVGVPCFEFDNRDPANLELLMRWKSAQYRRTGRFDRFARKWFVDTVRDLFHTRTDNFATYLSTMYVLDRPVSLDLALGANGVLAGWFPAYDTSFSAYGPGLLHLFNSLRLAAEEGAKLYDLGAGDAPYKLVFKDFNGSIAEGTIRRPSPIAWARRVQTAPKRVVTKFVLGQPALRRTAREALNQIGRIRSSLGGGLLLVLFERLSVCGQIALTA